ncbi:MAG: ArnT family glycosyltransferase [Nitrospinales bacterium]
MPASTQSTFSAIAGNDRFLLPLVCFLMFIKRFLLLDYGYNYEEGKELECVINILNGKMIYRDFFWQYGPGPLYVFALLFKIFGEVNFLIPRGVVSLVAVLTTFYSYRVARIYLPAPWAFWAALMASSGLAAREGTYGHGFAYLGMIASFYYLLRFFKRESSENSLIASGLFVFMALLSKPIVFGAGAVVSGLFGLGLWTLCKPAKQLPWIPIAKFLAAGLLPAFFVFGYLFWHTPTNLFIASLLPMTSGSLSLGEFNIKPLFPPIPAAPWQEWLTGLNKYLVDSFRWWTILLTVAGGIGVIIKGCFRDGKSFHGYFFLVILLIYALLVESETIILIQRPITFYINMLPSYILLAMFLIWLKEKMTGAVFVRSVALIFCITYFFYPPIRLGLYYWTNTKPLALKYAENIKVPDYTRTTYRNIAEYIQKHTPPEKPIVFAGYNSFIYLSSNRASLFPEDFATFTRVSFHPYHSGKAPFPKAFYKKAEAKIVERIQTGSASMILIPKAYLEENNLKKSVFLQYLVKNWKSRGVLNSGLRPGPFDKVDLTLEVFVREGKNG